jgi:hypothetical protein
MSDWITDYYADVDAMDLQSYLDRHTDDAEVVFEGRVAVVTGGARGIGRASVPHPAGEGGAVDGGLVRP